MSYPLMVWISTVLFLVHEFEEIAMIRPWLAKHKHTDRARGQAFWSFRGDSTSTIAVLIFEEFILFSLIALISMIISYPPVFVGFLVPYAIHLVGHIVESVKLRMITPSVFTSILTLPWYVYVIILCISQDGSGLAILLWAIICSVLIGANFAMIYSLKPRVNSWLSE